MGRRARCPRSADNESQQISQLYPEKCGSGKSSRGTSKFTTHAQACILAQKYSVFCRKMYPCRVSLSTSAATTNEYLKPNTTDTFFFFFFFTTAVKKKKFCSN